MGSLGMLFYIVECFTVNLENFAANAVGGLDIRGVDQKVQGNGGFVAKALAKAAHQVDHVGGLNTEGAEVGDEMAEVSGLIFNGLLKVGEAGNGLFWRGAGLAAQHIELNLD